MTYRFLSENKFKESEKKLSVINPYTGEKTGEYFQAGEEDFNKSVNYLKKAFHYYRKLPAYLKKELLYKISNKISDNKTQLASLITGETGKPIKFSHIETERAILTFRLGAELSSDVKGEFLSLDLLQGSEGKTAIVRNFPYGLILGITPWNFPVNLIAHKVSPALASSNVILIKPASASSLSAIRLAEIIHEACEELNLEFLPFNLLTLPGFTIDKKLNDENIKIISFTGSAEVGWNIKKKASKQKVLLELGGNAGVIVNDDADLELAVSKTILGGFAQAGQSCISIQRVYVHEKIYDDFREKLIEETKKVKFGNPFDENVLCGPMINEKEAMRAEEWINEARSSGAVVLYG
ncbi:MAG: aldehyde dehydrogenase family protein, partial [Ignavibacteria bacterium]|nr:aldehyde dehydrogenase family protein [Ignavibacteria bacterium]